MEKTTFDPGFTQKYTGSIRRIINENGEFNVRRRGANWHDIHPYLYMINTTWPRFLANILVAYLILNFIFAGFYWAAGVEHLHGAEAPTPAGRFLNAFFFSAHTLTTVGYGSIAPEGVVANSVAAVEALCGLMTFALATGLLFGRFSRPAARLAFSRQMLVAPFRDGLSLQFRVANRRSNNLMEIDAKLLLATVEPSNGSMKRKYANLTLERPSVLFLPLSWTIVHPINETSPLYGKTPDDLTAMQAEFLVLLKAFDDTFYQIVHTRHSYRYDEIAWHAQFEPAFSIDPQGDVLLDVERIGSYRALTPV
jgi:inward rectifier potassium channel